MESHLSEQNLKSDLWLTSRTYLAICPREMIRANLCLRIFSRQMCAIKNVFATMCVRAAIPAIQAFDHFFLEKCAEIFSGD